MPRITPSKVEYDALAAGVSALEVKENWTHAFARGHFWYGNTGSNSYVDVPVSSLSGSYRRQGMLVMAVTNSDGAGWVGYVGITNSGDIKTVSTINNSASVSPTASTDKTANTVRIDVKSAWSTVFVISDLNIRW